MTKKKQPKSKLKSNLPEKKQSIPTNHILWLIGIIILTIVAFSGSFDNKITNFDDAAYTTQNPLIQNLNFQNIEKIFSEPYYGGYYPLTLLSFGIDLKIGGEDPTNMLHFTNLFLHLLNIILLWWLVFLLFKNLTITIIVTTLFGIHTLHVESVAWISERKDVLYTFFYLLSILAYIKYLKIGKPKFYLLAFFLFFFSLLSKTMAASLAVTLFIVDYLILENPWKKKLIIEKIPFVAFAIFFGLISIWSQKSIGIIADENPINFFEKVIYACYGFAIYIAKLLVPFKLSAFYPYPESFNWLYLIFILPVASFVYAIVRFWNSNKIIVFGLLFYALNIVLVLQFIQINNFIIADRFTYVTSIGIFILMAYFIDKALKNNKSKKNLIVGLFTAYIIVLTIFTTRQIKTWKDSKTVWTSMIEQYPDRIRKAYYFRGHEYAEEGLYDQALKDFSKVIELKQSEYLPLAHHSLATTYANQGKIEEALAEVSKAIELDATNLSFYYLRAQIYMNMRRMHDAENEFNLMIEVQPKNYMAYYYRAAYFAQIQKFEKAILDYTQVIELEPTLAEAYYYRAGMKLQLQLKDEACKDLYQAEKLGFKEASQMIQSYCFN